MKLDFSKLDAAQCYKVLLGVVVPRPIALVTSRDENGKINAAPFSFFNCMGSDPPMVALGIGNRDAQTPKDSARNIRRSGEFVVNVVSEEIVEAMNLCATDFPPGVSEIEIAGLALAPASFGDVPRLADSPASLACREMQTLEIGRNRVVFGEVRGLDIRDDLIDAEKLYVDSAGLHAVGRMQGPGWYCKTREMFSLPRLSFEAWQKLQNG